MADKNKFNPDWLIEELQIQMAVLEMTDEKKKVYDVIRAIEILKKDLNVFYFPAVMNFVSIQRPVAPPPPPPPIPPSGIPYHAGGQVLFNPNTHGISPCGIPAISPVVNINATSAPMVSVFGGTNVPCSPVPCSPVPAMLMPISVYPHPSWNNNPKPGDRIFGLFNENGKMGQCLYTWQEEDNPEEITAYASGFDNFNSFGRKYIACKKFQHEKFLVICQDGCCEQD